MTSEFETKKIVFLGQINAGKSAIVERMTRGTFEPSWHAKTVGADIETKEVHQHNKDYKLQIWDMGGNPLYPSITKAFIQGANLSILVIPSHQELQRDYYHEMVKTVTSELGDNAPIMVVLHHFEGETPIVSNNDLTQLFAQYPNFAVCEHDVDAKQNFGIKALEEEVCVALKIKERLNQPVTAPNSYYSLWNKKGKSKQGLDPSVAKIKAMMLDYTKDNSRLKRVATFHWNRHYLDDVERLIKTIDSNTSAQELLNALKGIDTKNDQGSLARRIQFIEQQLKSENIIQDDGPTHKT